MIISIAGFVVYTDPFQVFHRHQLPAGLIDNERFQNAGLINSHLADPALGYDSVLIGTSLSQNFTSQSAQKLLGFNHPLRLFLSGGSPAEQSMLLVHALHTGRAHRVLWELHPHIYLDSREPAPVNNNQFPAYLYNDNLFDDAHYIFNLDILLLAGKLVRTGHAISTLTPDTLGYWGDLPGISEQHRQFNAPEHLQALLQQPRMNIAEYATSFDPTGQRYPAVDIYVMPVLKDYCNADIQFYMFIPPISRIDYLFNPPLFLRNLYLEKYLLDKLQDCRNIALFAFDDMDFTGDLNNYKDDEHYLPYINDLLLSLMGKSQHAITAENFEEYKAHAIQQMDNYRIYSTYPAKPAG